MTKNSASYEVAPFPRLRQLIVDAGRVEIRECLSLTVDFDHDIVHGTPAARFI